MVKERSQPMVPELGEWYHLNAYMLPGANHHSFCLCTELDADSVTLHVRKHQKTEIFKAAIKEIKRAQWVVKNSFHMFCLFKLKQILKALQLKSCMATSVSSCALTLPPNSVYIGQIRIMMLLTMLMM